MEDNFSMDEEGGADGMVQVAMRGMGDDGERQMKLHLLAHLPLTFCCAARFLTDRGIGDS